MGWKCRCRWDLTETEDFEPSDLKRERGGKEEKRRNKKGKREKREEGRGEYILAKNLLYGLLIFGSTEF